MDNTHQAQYTVRRIPQTEQNILKNGLKMRNKLQALKYWYECNILSYSKKCCVFIQRIVVCCLFLVLSSMSLFTSCSTTKSLESNQQLYKKSNLEFEDVQQKDSRLSTDGLKSYIVPKPNKKFMGVVPFRLWMYNLAGDSVPKKGFRHWLKTKVGEAPVQYKSYYTETSERELGNEMKNMGYFKNTISSEVIEKGQKVTLDYSIKPGIPTKVDTLIYPSISDSITKYLADFRQKTLIHNDDYYDLDVLKNERKRLSDQLKDFGFFYASPDIFLFKADTIHAKDNGIKLNMEIKKNTAPVVKNIYHIGKVYVHHDPENEQEILPDSLFDDGIYHYFDGEPSVQSRVLNRCIFFKTGDIYKEKNYKLTLNKLMNLRVYKYLNIRFIPDSSSQTPVLDANLYLNSAMPKSVSAEFQAVSKSNGYMGPGISLSYQERNLNRSATTFKAELTSSYEAQFGKQGQSSNVFELGANIGFTFPRLLVPFLDDYARIPRKYSPKTKASVGYSFSGRNRVYDFNSLDLTYGYVWHESKTKTHELSIPFISYTYINPHADWSYIYNFIDEDLEEQLIMGLDYTFTYNDQNVKKVAINTYFNGSVEVAGNTLSLLESAFTKDSPDKGATILGIAYSQYVKFYTDLRFYHPLSSDSKLVSRLAFGLGIPYGNSRYIPYNKQFYSGGVSSIRAFEYQSLGPGTFMPADSISSDIGIDQAGDIKLEANLEYRFGISGYLKGAMFMDAGNVWLLKDIEELPGGKFYFKEFYKQIAVGTGVGLRLDAGFFVLRLDVAFPIRTPYEVDGKNWMFNDINLFKSSWRKDNLVYNIAFGYPF